MFIDYRPYSLHCRCELIIPRHLLHNSWNNWYSDNFATHHNPSHVSTLHSFQIHHIHIRDSRLSEKLAADLAAHLPSFSALRKIWLWGLTISEAGLVGLVEAARAIREMERIMWVYSVIGTFFLSFFVFK